MKRCTGYTDWRGLLFFKTSCILWCDAQLCTQMWARMSAAFLQHHDITSGTISRHLAEAVLGQASELAQGSAVAATSLLSFLHCTTAEDDKHADILREATSPDVSQDADTKSSQSANTESSRSVKSESSRNANAGPSQGCGQGLKMIDTYAVGEDLGSLGRARWQGDAVDVDERIGLRIVAVSALGWETSQVVGLR